MSHPQEDPRPSLRIDAVLAELAGRQCGVFSYEEALRRGVTKQQLQRRVQSGLLVRCHPRVFAMPGMAEAWKQRATAALKWGGSSSALSHKSAGRLWGICDPDDDDPIEISCSRDLRSREDVLVHHVRSLRSGDMCLRGHLKLTTPTRTMIDLASVLDEESLLSSIEEATLAGLFDLPKLRRRMDQVGSRGRPGMAKLKRLVDGLLDEGLLPRSVLERRYLRASALAKMPAPRLQFPVEVKGRKYYIDFAYPSHHVAVEMDGWRFHGGRTRWEADIARSNDLVSAGWRVVRGTWRDVQDHAEEFLERVRALLQPKIWE